MNQPEIGPQLPDGTPDETAVESVVESIEDAASGITAEAQQLVEAVTSQWVEWTQVLAFAALIVFAVLIVHFVVFAIAARAAKKTKLQGDEIVVRLLRLPSRIILVLLALQFILPSSRFSETATGIIRHGLALLLIAAVTWLVVRIIQSVAQFVLVQYRVEHLFDSRSRRINTQLRVLSRILIFVAVIVGLAVALMTFPAIQHFGASILASAGITGLIVGLAAQKVIANFLAGLQIAFTGPIHLGDVVVIEDEWGRIEEITSTYVVLKIWDERRLIVPFTRIIDKPFYNWSRREPEVLGTIYIYADYSVPIDAVRREAERIVRASDHWDGRSCSMVVTNATERAVELRVCISAADGGKQWNLRCEVREKMIEYLQREYPNSLPRTRMVVANDLPTDGRAGLFDAPAPEPG